MRKDDLTIWLTALLCAGLAIASILELWDPIRVTVNEYENHREAMKAAKDCQDSGRDESVETLYRGEVPILWIVTCKR